MLDFVDAYSVSNLGVAIKYYRVSAPPEGPYHLFLRLSTGKIERMPTPLKHLRYGISISPDGQYLIYADSDYEVSDLRLVDGL